MYVTHDKKLTVSFGKSREEKRWKNKKLLWSDLLERLCETHRTAETVNDYHNFPKSKRDEIKDIGGFVGGNISGGRRKKGAITFRTLITLDIDYAKENFDVWGLFTLLYENAACIYSTHSHTVENPRLRIVIPLDREIDADEYQPISRRIAGHLDIEIFDNTTFQPERLMYWPSTPDDGDYVFMHQDGPILCADDILNSYYDWKDASQWPISEKSTEAIKRGAKKQGDPKEKPGIIGAFNRTFTITEAIENYLQEQYEETNLPDRYTFKGGSTSGGLIVYDDIFAYSHHGTDPISEKLCSAFDLVRVHLFGQEDDQTEDKTPINKRPSFLSMRTLALKNKKVKRALVTERVNKMGEAFGEIDTEQQEGETVDDNEQDELQATTDWHEQLEVDEKGNIRSTIDNAVKVIENDQHLKGRIAIDEFRNNMVKVKRLKWDKANRYLFQDSDEANLRRYVEHKYGITGAGRIRDAIDIVANDNIFHPVRDYFNTLSWDGVERIDTLLVDYLGAEDDDYTRAVTRKWLTAGIARVMEPGCKFDYMLCLQGKQGAKKSTFFNLLGKGWYNGSFNFGMIGKKDSVEQLQGSWIVEIGEMAGMSRMEHQAIKAFISNQKDEMRPAYGRFKMEYMRQCIFGGTFNEDEPFTDPTGGRRYWPVKVVKGKNFDKLGKIIDQIWAEAMCLYMAGENLYLNEQLEEIANNIQDQFTEKDVRTGDLLRYLEMKVPEGWYELDTWERREYLNGPIKQEGTKRQKITIMEIWSELFGGSVKDITKRDSRAINDMMRDATNWEICRFNTDGLRERGYRRKLSISKKLSKNLELSQN